MVHEKQEKRLLALDGEWGKDNETLCVSMASEDKTGVIYMNRDLKLPSDTVARINIWSAKHSKVSVEWVTYTDDTNLVEKHLKTLGNMCAELLVFYSPSDLNRSLGFNNVEPLYKRGVSKSRDVARSGIKQDRCLRAFNVKVGKVRLSIHDLKGWASVGGLKTLAESVGVVMTSKNDMDEYKSDMLAGLIAEPEKFLDYAWGDVVDMFAIKAAFIKSVKSDVALDILGVGLDGNLPHTIGSIVNKTWLTWLHGLTENPDAFEYAIRKLGILDSGAKKHDEAVNVLALARDVYKSVDDIKAHPKYLQQLKDCKFRAVGYSQCGVKELARQPSSAAFNALVQGGRCNNEHPWAYEVGIGADIDLKSCYGNSLVAFNYPVGLPTIWGGTENQRADTLKKWLDDTSGQRVPGLWTVTVSGKLSFSQDLLFSKLTKLEDIQRCAARGFNDDLDADEEKDNPSHIPGEFTLSRTHLVNTIVTDDLWKALVSIATPNEMGDMLKLKVVSAVAYLKKDEVMGSVDEWVETVIADNGEYRTKSGNAATIIDDRTRAWFRVPIANFIEPLVNARNVLKGALKKDPSLKPKDTAIKLFINALYGNFCSPHFLMGNTVVANNITARARLGVYMMNKALWTVQSITDGGIYSPVSVPYLEKGTKPGLSVFSSRSEWLNHRRPNRTLKPLKGLDWDKLIYQDMTMDELNSLASNLDVWALEHVNEFWDVYKVTLPFSIEHKPENTFVRAAYWSKGNYGLLRALEPGTNPDPTKNLDSVKYAVRGTKNYKEGGLRKSPTYQLLDNILNGSDEFPEDMAYDHFSLLKLKMWNVYQASNGVLDNKHYRPGDGVTQERIAHYNNTHMPVDNPQEYLTKVKRVTSRTRNLETINVELFEKFGELGISGVHGMMMRNLLRKAATDPVVDESLIEETLATFQ